MAVLLEVRDLIRVQPGYRGRDFKLGPLSFDLAPGEVLGLAGPNGAGKSTLLLVLAGLLKPGGGEVRHGGQKINLAGGDWRARIGLLRARETAFYPNLSARENLRFFAALGGMSGAEAARRIDRSLEQAGLDLRAEEPVRVYSSGMQASLALARTLMREPEILLLDEPARSLDSASAAAFIRLLRIGLEGRSALWVSHSAGELERGASRVLHMHDGEIITPPPPGGFLVLTANGEALGGVGGLVWDDDLGGLRLLASGDLPAALSALRERGVEILGVERLAAETRTGARA